MKLHPVPRIAAPIHDSILDTIGNTPVVRLNRIAPTHAEVFVKVEAFNPGGSIKDRFALAAIEAAEASGALKPGQTVVEATSGNTGIGLALVCAAKGYPLVVTMAESFSIERRKLMRFLGAKVVLTPAALKGTGMLAKAEELAREHGWFLARQFENEANADMHSRTTAREILAAFGGKGPDVWVSGFGTGGTLKGVGRVLRAESPATRIVVAEPDNAPILGSGIAQMRDGDGRPAASHPMFRPHLMQGWSPDFIPKLAEDAVASGTIDAFQPVAGNDALNAARALAAKEGIFCGISGGATLAAALKLAGDAPAGTRILAMLPDTGERYLSTVLFDEVSATMTEDEIALSRSTPGYRFDTAAPAPAAAAAPPVKPEAAAMVDRIVAENPVTLFVLEWCEFSWSVRRLLAAADVPYHAVELDSAALQKDNLGGDLRAALGAKVGAPTIPQVFVGGVHLGGATETLDAVNDGTLAARLGKLGIGFDGAALGDAYGYLPAWLHPR